MTRIYAPNEGHNYDQDGIDFVYGAAVVPSAKADVIAEFTRKGYTTSTGEALTEMDKLPKDTLLAIATELDLTVSEDITKQWLVVAINTAIATSTETDYAVTYANGNASATGTAPTETDKFIGDEITVKANTFTLTGSTFTGWKDGDGNDYQPGDKVIMKGVAITFTAQWEAD